MTRGFKIALFIICICLFQNFGVNAQDGSLIVKGFISDSKDKSPIQGVTVSETDADGRVLKGTVSDIEGNYAIKMTDSKNKLNFSYIGYKTVEVDVKGRSTMNISLASSTTDLGEVVVVAARRQDNGMGPISEKNSTVAASRINAKEMEEMQAASIDQMLQGRLAGVDIAANSGDPGSGMAIRIRGTNSINSSTNPLIVVDGMPLETEVPSDFNFGAADEVGYAQLLNISPSDIRDITVLKDAAATAVWGSRAANGVLVINTKRGGVTRPTIGYSFKGSMVKQPNSVPMLTGDQYSMLIPEEVMNATGAPLNTLNTPEFRYDPNDPYYYYNYSNNTDWVAAITQLGYAQDHNLSLQGGGEKARYFTSFGYFDQRGTTIGTGLSRFTSRVNLDYRVSEKITFRSDFSYSKSGNDRSYTSGSSSADALRNIAYTKMPNMAIYEYDVYGNLTPNYFSPIQNIQGYYPGTYNPVAMGLAASNNFANQRIVPHFNLQYDIVKTILRLTFDVQFDINNTKNKSFLPQIATGRPYTETVVNRAYDGDLDVFNVQSKTNLVYTPKLKSPDHHLMTFGSFFTYDNKSVSHEALTSNTASSELQDPSIPSRIANNELRLANSTYQTRSLGALISAQYDYKEKYIFNAGLRGDGNSRFGPQNRYGLFPSFSARWRVSDEKFVRRVKQINELSLRASYGQSGNAPRRDYTFYNTYGNFTWNYLGQAGVYSANIQLDNLKWESIEGVNFGFNLGMFNRRLNVDGELYRNRTRNMFFNGLQISSITGFNAVDMNVGTMDNMGWELNLNAVPYRDKDVQVDFNFNIAANQNIIREISEFYPTEKGNIEANGQYKTFMQVDNPFGSFYGFKYTGVYKDMDATVARDANGNQIVGPNGQLVYMRFNYPKTDYIFKPGDAMYEDLNHDGNINYMDVVYLGNSNPKFSGGFGPAITYKKNLRISAFFSYRYGYNIINGTKMTTTNMYGYGNQSTAVLKRWRNPGDVTDMPRALYRNGFNWLGSDRYVEDASYLRFRSLTARYTFNKNVLKRLGAKAFSAYATIENLFTFTQYTGQDPEVVPRGSDPFRVAIDYSQTPPGKTFTVGLTFSY